MNAERLAEAGAACAKLVGEANVLVVPTDVSKLEDVERLRDRVLEQWGEVSSQNLLALSLREGASCVLDVFLGCWVSTFPSRVSPLALIINKDRRDALHSFAYPKPLITPDSQSSTLNNPLPSQSSIFKQPNTISEVPKSLPYLSIYLTPQSLPPTPPTHTLCL